MGTLMFLGGILSGVNKKQAKIKFIPRRKRYIATEKAFPYLGWIVLFSKLRPNATIYRCVVMGRKIRGAQD